MILLAKRKTATWSGLHRLARKLEFKQSVVNQKQKRLMALSHYRKQRIMLLARLNLGLASEDQEEVDLYNHYQKNIYSEQNQQQQQQ